MTTIGPTPPTESIHQAAAQIHTAYAAVASGATDGSGGSFAADGKRTLVAVSIPVELLETLAVALGRPTFGRTITDRNTWRQQRKGRDV